MLDRRHDGLAHGLWLVTQNPSCEELWPPLLFPTQSNRQWTLAHGESDIEITYFPGHELAAPSCDIISGVHLFCHLLALSGVGPLALRHARDRSFDQCENHQFHCALPQ